MAKIKTDLKPNVAQSGQKQVGHGYINQAETGDRLTCAVESTIKVIGGRWKVLILRELFEEAEIFTKSCGKIVADYI